MSEVNTTEKGTPPWSQADTLQSSADDRPASDYLRTFRDRARHLSASGGATPTEEPYERRWLALAVIAVTVLMVILDATIVNIALP